MMLVVWNCRFPFLKVVFGVLFYGIVLYGIVLCHTSFVPIFYVGYYVGGVLWSSRGLLWSLRGHGGGQDIKMGIFR